MRRWAVKLLLGAVGLAAVVLLFLLPVHTLLYQHDQTNAAKARLKGLSQENQQLARQAALLQNPGEIQRIARSQYGLVLPGQRAYGIVPPPPSKAAPAKPKSTTTTTKPASPRLPAGLGPKQG
jgi:cell division protein FtsB